MKKLLLILLVISGIQVAGQSTWQITNTPSGGQIWDIEGSEANLLYTVTGSGMYKSVNNGSNWEPIYFEDGIIRVFTVIESGEIFASHDSLVYKSADNGTTWDLVLTASGNFISMTKGPQNAVYGSTMGSNGAITLYLSLDGGLTWDQKAMNVGAYSHLNLHVNSSGDLFSASFEGLYRSVDQGDSWELINNGAIRSLLIKSNDELVIGIFYDEWLYESSDNGISWSHLFNTSAIYPLAEDSSGFIYASSEIGVFRISPDGINWSQINKGLPSDQILAMYVNSGDEVFVGANGIYRSTNHGVIWIPSSDGLNVGSFTFINSSSDGDIYVIADALYVSSDEGATYHSLIDFKDWEMTFTQVYIHPEGEIFAVGYNRYTWDNYTLFRSSDNGNTFSELIHFHINDFAISPDGSIFVVSDNGVLRSSDKGNNWELVFDIYECLWYRHILVSTTGTTYLCACDNIYASNDNGDTYNMVAGNSLDFKATNSLGHIFAFDQNNIVRSANNGLSWEVIYTNDLPYNQLKNLIVDSYDNVYFNLSFSGIFKSTNNGDTWSLYNEGLINHNVIAMHATSNGTLYISPEYNGVWKRSAITNMANNATSFEVYPNPARENISIRLKTNGTFEEDFCRIYDTQGRIMKEVVITSSATELTISDFKPGFYILKSSHSVQKILVQ